MAFGFGLPGAAVPGEGERTHIRHHRTDGTSAEVDLHPGEFSVSNLPSLDVCAPDLSTFRVRDEAHNTATFSPIAGSSSIVTVGTIATGTWSATAVGATKGGTGLTSCALGDLLYASGANTWASLAANSSATRKFLRSVSSGAPAWDTLQAGDIPDLSATYALAGLASIFTGSGNTSTYQQTTSTSWVRLNSQLSGVDGVTWTNSSGRTQQVLVLITCSVSSDGLHASYFRVGCSGSGVTATLQGSFRTPVSNYVPATLAAVVSVTSGSTATLYVQASVAGGGTAYLHEGGDSTWTLIGIPIG